MALTGADWPWQPHASQVEEDPGTRKGDGQWALALCREWNRGCRQQALDSRGVMVTLRHGPTQEGHQASAQLRAGEGWALGDATLRWQKVEQ